MSCSAFFAQLASGISHLPCCSLLPLLLLLLRLLFLTIMLRHALGTLVWDDLVLGNNVVWWYLV